MTLTYDLLHSEDIDKANIYAELIKEIDKWR